ncbi:hypothetical protein [Lentzea albidocapillata]|uniref:Ubiquinol-cytochrome c reductase cytochrome b subunit n=1 Tax=Lentzea albidocapillata TaxID=40571 RepID=A0A1W2FSE4_9PSEU|nr:ubiquinol-cytochrome c reductase cytochrome b subunit [Lentzea albidocapillata]
MTSSYRVCLGQQRRDRETLEHSIETGIVKRQSHGAFLELHQPLGRNGLPYAGAPVPKKPNEIGAAGKPVPGGFFSPDPQNSDERR